MMKMLMSRMHRKKRMELIPKSSVMHKPFSGDVYSQGGYGVGLFQ
jgi:hypothetical protein